MCIRDRLHIGTMFALKPYSQVGYDIEQLDSIEGTGKYIRKYSGNGGTYESVSYTHLFACCIHSRSGNIYYFYRSDSNLWHSCGA